VRAHDSDELDRTALVRGVAVRKLGRSTSELVSETASMAVSREFEISCGVLLKFERAYVG
jgi:hypothetical protein